MNTVLNIQIDFFQIFNLLKQLPYSERKKIARMLEKKEIDDISFDAVSTKKTSNRTFNAAKIDLTNFNFSRDEANER